MLQLTKGSLRKMLDGENVADPILQILQMKNIQNNMDGLTRYKVTLFDGEIQHTFGILATQKNTLVETNELKIGSVIKLEEYASNVLSKDPPKVVIILLNFEIIGEMDPKVTTSSSEAQKPNIQNENIEPKSVEKPIQPQSKSFYSNNDTQASKVVSKLNNTTNNASASQPGMFNNFKIFGISSLNPYQNKWSIKARVTNKSDIRTYNNAKGPGKLFSVEFIDQTGEIRATGFNETVDRYYDMLQVDNVYYISRAQLKTANKQYSKLDNDYEMTFSNDTLIEPCHEAEADELPHMNINLVPLSEIANKQANEFADVIGVVKTSNDVTTIVTKATNKELKKREISLVDNSNFAISCTLWGKQAEDFDGSENPVVLIKGAKVGDYNGKNLSVPSTAVLQINPDIPEAHTLRGWFDQGGASDVTELSNVQGGAGSQTSGSIQTAWKALDTLRDDRLGTNDKGDYLMTKATLLFAKKDNALYMACPGDNCNKKVIDQNDGTYRCEKCAKNYPNFNWRMILNVNIADYADSNWATCFQETAEHILGVKADELGELKSSNNPNYDDIFANSVFKEYNFKLRAKMETYNDERRVKVSVISIEDIDYVASSKRLLQNIRAYVKNNP